MAGSCFKTNGNLIENLLLLWLSGDHLLLCGNEKGHSINYPERA